MKVTDRFVVPRPAPWESGPASLHVPVLPRAPEAHPCSDCLAMCCWFVLVETGELESVDELDAISEHLDYERMVVWIQADGGYTLGLISPCHYFERQTCACSVHDTPTQPDICRRFDARICWYRAHHEPDSPLNWARLDGGSWGAFREGIEVDGEGDVVFLPAPRGLRSQRRSYEVPALLQFDVPEDAVEAPEQRADLLYFLSNFAGIELARTPEAWHFLYPTRRDRDAPPREIEVIGGQVGGYPADSVVRPTRDQVHALFREHGSRLWGLGPDDLIAAGASPASSQSAGGSKVKPPGQP